MTPNTVPPFQGTSQNPSPEPSTIYPPNKDYHGAEPPNDSSPRHKMLAAAAFGKVVASPVLYAAEATTRLGDATTEVMIEDLFLHRRHSTDRALNDAGCTPSSDTTASRPDDDAIHRLHRKIRSS